MRFDCTTIYAFNLVLVWCLYIIYFRLQETLDQLAAKLESVYIAAGKKKINIISHSMGGLLVKCFMSLHSDVKFPNKLLWYFFFLSSSVAFYFPFSNCGFYWQFLCVSLLRIGFQIKLIIILFHRFLRSMWKTGLLLLHHSKVIILHNLVKYCTNSELVFEDLFYKIFFINWVSLTCLCFIFFHLYS